LRIYSITIIPVSMWVAQWIWIYIEGKQAVFIKQTTIGAILSLLSGAILIPIFNLKGAALSAVLSQFTAYIFVIYFIDKKLFHIQFNFFKLPQF
jgi:O-antigen/teichoic acid export membrane protein